MPAETFRSTGEAAEGTFLSVDPGTNVQTFVTVFAGLSGSNDEPQVVIQVFQTDAAGYLFFSADYVTGGYPEYDDIVPEFTMKGPHLISAHLEGTVLMSVATPATVATLATFYFTFQANGRTIHEVENDRLVLVGETVQTSHINSFQRPATGTITIEGLMPPVPLQYSTEDAELLWYKGAFAAGGSPDWIF